MTLDRTELLPEESARELKGLVEDLSRTRTAEQEEQAVTRLSDWTGQQEGERQVIISYGILPLTGSGARLHINDVARSPHPVWLRVTFRRRDFEERTITDIYQFTWRLRRNSNVYPLLRE